jgi:hypothetical protein
MAEVPDPILDPLRGICLGLPEVQEFPMSAGFRWLVRKRPFAYVHPVDGPNGEVVIMIFRSEPPELAALHNSGHPFFKPGWGKDTVGMVLEDATDWKEVGELVADSYCLVAPKKLAEQVTP